MSSYSTRYATLPDVDVVADQLHRMLHELYPHRVEMTYLSAQFLVNEWVADDITDVMLVVKGTEIVGFSIGQEEDYRGMLKTFYNSMLTYILPTHRRTRAIKKIVGCIWESAYKRGLNVESNNVSPQTQSIAKTLKGKVLGNITYVTVNQPTLPI